MHRDPRHACEMLAQTIVKGYHFPQAEDVSSIISQTSGESGVKQINDHNVEKQRAVMPFFFPSKVKLSEYYRGSVLRHYPNATQSALGHALYYFVYLL